MTAPCFYERTGARRFRATVNTRGPWDAGAQHGGPPTALVTTVMEQHEPRDDMQVARVTVEFLRPVPIGELDVECHTLKPGRSTMLVGASLRHAGTEVLRATALRIRTMPLALPAGMPAGPPSPPPPSAARLQRFFPTAWDEGYHTAMDGLFVRGGFDEVGPGLAWLRMRHPLVDDEPVTPLCRVMIAADSGNGVASALDYRAWTYINPELTVHLHRLPAGPWVALDARTTVEPNGLGLAESIIFDEQGAVGRGLQALVVQPRR